MFWNWRIIRIAIGLGLLVLGLIVVLPNITGYTSLDGTVNARIVDISAPIEGTIVENAPKIGTPVVQGVPVLSIRNDRVNRFQLSELEADLQATTQILKSLASEENELISLRNDLQRKYTLYQDAMDRNIEREIVNQEQRIGADEARRQEVKAQLERKEQLGVTGHLAQADLDRARAAERIAQHEFERSLTELDRLKHKHEAAARGVYIEEGRNDVPYSSQRMDEITIALLNLSTRRAEQEARLTKLRQQATDEEKRINMLGYATLRASVTGVIWRNYVVAGSNVTVGQELMTILNCNDLFVDIIVHEVDSDDIYPGRDAVVLLLGRAEPVLGQVTFVRGSRADFDDKILAASLPRTEGKYAKIRVQLAASDFNTDFENFCQVGRSVHVRFRRQSVPFVRWLQSLWFTIS